MSFFTCFWLFPQKEHLSRSPPSPMRATGWISFAQRAGTHRRYPVSPTHGSPFWGASWAVRSGRTAPRPSRGRGGRNLAGGDHHVDDPIGEGVVGGEDLVALDVPADLGD